MADYIRVYETSNESQANKYIENGWDLIDTQTRNRFDGEGGYSSYTNYTLGLSSKVYANKLLSIVKEYEKYGLKEVLFEKIEEETDDKISNYQQIGGGFKTPSETQLAKFVSNYEDIVNNEKVLLYKNEEKYNFDIDPDNMPF